MSEIRNWSLLTQRDMLFQKYGYNMSKEHWDWYTGEGLDISSEQHLAFEVGLATERRFYPKAEFLKAFNVMGYAEQYGASRNRLPVKRSDGGIGSVIVTSPIAWVQKDGDEIVICTKSGSVYQLEGEMGRNKEYSKPEDTEYTTEELNEIMGKYFKFKEVESA